MRLLALQPQQQPHWLQDDGFGSSMPMCAPGRPPDLMAAALQPSVCGQPQLSGAAQQQDGSDKAGQQAGLGRLSMGPEGAGAAAAVLALAAAAAAGPRARASAAQQHMAPGKMLAQSPICESLFAPAYTPPACCLRAAVCL